MDDRGASMTGREVFTKYGSLIQLLVGVAKHFPKSFRQRRLAAACMARGSIGQLRRYVWISTIARAVGANVAISPNVFFEHVDKLSIGNNVSIHQMCYIDAGGEIEIGNDVSVAHRTTILSSNHHYNDMSIPIKYQGMKHAKTVIDDNVWIGCGVTVLAGVHIGTGSVIGANSVVTKSIEENSVAVGNPAAIIKSRKG